LKCLRSRVEHLREAMPFDRIHITMSLRAVYERGIRLFFEYYRYITDDDRQKLAVGEYDAAWVTCKERDSARPALLPQEVRDVLLRVVEAP
ncbi:MAG: hypothetical protein O7E52_14210, partial [Candidatus Poribacteria bacterium]|nr:hypothetical protein [Candidatus Poribacteria bacterium]